MAIVIAEDVDGLPTGSAAAILSCNGFRPVRSDPDLRERRPRLLKFSRVPTISVVLGRRDSRQQREGGLDLRLRGRLINGRSPVAVDRHSHRRSCVRHHRSPRNVSGWVSLEALDLGPGSRARPWIPRWGHTVSQVIADGGPRDRRRKEQGPRPDRRCRPARRRRYRR